MFVLKPAICYNFFFQISLLESQSDKKQSGGGRRKGRERKKERETKKKQTFCIHWLTPTMLAKSHDPGTLSRCPIGQQEPKNLAPSSAAFQYTSRTLNWKPSQSHSIQDLWRGMSVSHAAGESKEAQCPTLSLPMARLTEKMSVFPQLQSWDLSCFTSSLRGCPSPVHSLPLHVSFAFHKASSVWPHPYKVPNTPANVSSSFNWNQHSKG